VQAMTDGTKKVSTRLWCAKTVKRLQSVVLLGACVRIQTNYEFDSICGWAVLDSVSEVAPAREVVTAAVVQLAGRGDLSVAEYITQYCSVSRPDGTLKAGFVAVVRFKHFWPVY